MWKWIVIMNRTNSSKPQNVFKITFYTYNDVGMQFIKWIIKYELLFMNVIEIKIVYEIYGLNYVKNRESIFFNNYSQYIEYT